MISPREESRAEMQHADTSNTITMEAHYLQSELFKGLTAVQCEAVIQAGSSFQLAPKSILYHQGDPAEYLYIVTSGHLKLNKLNEQGNEVILDYVRAGGIVAAVSALKHREYPVTAIAIENTEVTGWNNETILELIQAYPTIAINLLGIVLERIDDVQQRYLELSTERVEQRIARSLLRLMRSTGLKKPEGILINIPLSRQNIAEFSGTTLFTVSRTISVWEKKGWIQSGREKITITDPHSLVLFSEIA